MGKTGKLNVMGHTAIGYGVRRINMKNLRRKSEIWREDLYTHLSKCFTDFPLRYSVMKSLFFSVQHIY